jgi:hypothetical protein
MLKRVVLGTLLVGLIGILVVGAIIRTVDKTENVAEARGQGRGQSNVETVQGSPLLNQGQGQGQGRGGNGQNVGNGRQVENTERLYPNYQEVPDSWAAYEGTVAEAPESGGDLVLMAEDGTEIAVGTGPGYMESQGFVLEAGERVQVQGYWEDDELKAAQVTRLSDGQTIALRDQLGRPAWSGGGQRAANQTATTLAPGRGGYGGQGRTEAPGDGTSTGQAEVDEWLELQGTVISIEVDALVVKMSSGEQIVVENRPWWFAQEQGFLAQLGDEIRLVGFYEDSEFEVGRFENLESGQVVGIREASGRPLWAGGGRRSSW